MNSNSPLAASSVRSWRDSLAAKNETVAKITLDDGAEGYELKITPAGEIAGNQIINADYIVRASDWMPKILRLQIKKDGETLNFEITEKTSEVVAFNQLEPEIFAPKQLAKLPNSQISLSASPSASPSISPEESEVAAANTNSVQSVKTEKPAEREPASADLEVEVLNLLNQVKADMGEQIEVKRTAEGKLLVSGIIETEQRKNELLKALSPVINNPAIKVEILTVPEAVARQKTGKSNSPLTSQSLESQGNSVAAENDLREYFAPRGGDADANIRRFSASVVNASRQATQHLWALKKLVNQFTPAEEAKLTPEARAKLLGLIRSHAAAFGEQSAALRRQLKPVFFAEADERAAQAGGNVGSNSDLKRLVNQLIETGTANDGIVRSAFTASGDGVKITVVKTPQFWQSLKMAEALAAKIQAAR